MLILAQQILLGATFTSSTTAAITWDQPPGIGHTCLHRYYGAAWPAAICWRDLPEGPTRVDLPGIYDKRFYWPAHGDVYVLSHEGIEVARTTLGEVPSTYYAYLPSMTKQSAPLNMVRLPVVLR